jgi:hypothetical protein
MTLEGYREHSGKSNEMIQERFRRQIELPCRYNGGAISAAWIKNWLPIPNCATVVNGYQEAHFSGF